MWNPPDFTDDVTQLRELAEPDKLYPVLTCAGPWDAPHDELRVTTRLVTQFCTCGLSLTRDEMTQQQILAADTV
jgi:hypothetical protein